MSESAPVSKAIFLDEVDIVLIAGNGGNGCVSFRREKYIPKGGPNGGDGAKGGSVYIYADDQYNTLQHLAGKHHWRAKTGGHGMGKNRHGKNGEDTLIPVPPGTMIYDAETGICLKDLTAHDDRVCLARGGSGGKGNAFFKTPTQQAPRIAETGEPGQDRKVHLELKLMADAGLLGKPNAGKSTLMSRLSAAKPKIANYPFTTLKPSLGIVELPGFRRFVMADIPGLIEGAHKGAGLGDEFLRHIERTSVLVHMLDICPPAGDPVDDYHAIRAELVQYSPTLAEKPEIIVANKMDLTGSDEIIKTMREKLSADVVAISAVTGTGLKELAGRIWDLIEKTREQ